MIGIRPFMSQNDLLWHSTRYYPIDKSETITVKNFLRPLRA